MEKNWRHDHLGWQLSMFILEMDNEGKPDIISPVTYSEEGNILENPTLKSVRKGLDCHEMFLQTGVLHSLHELDRWRAKHPSGSLDISGPLRSTREKRTRRRSPQDMSVDVSFFMFLRWARLEAATGSRTGLHVLWFRAEYVAAIAPYKTSTHSNSIWLNNITISKTFILKLWLQHDIQVTFSLLSLKLKNCIPSAAHMKPSTLCKSLVKYICIKDAWTITTCTILSYVQECLNSQKSRSFKFKMTEGITAVHYY